jgi:hypothetical protein
LYLDGSRSFDLDGVMSPLTYSWDLNNDGKFGDAVGMAPVVGWSTLVGYGFAMGASKTIALEVSDGVSRGVDFAQVMVTANGPLTAGGPYGLALGWSLDLAGSASYAPDAVAAPLTYRWDLNGNRDFHDAGGTFASIPGSKLVGFGSPIDTSKMIALEVFDGIDRRVDFAAVTAGDSGSSQGSQLARLDSSLVDAVFAESGDSIFSEFSHGGSHELLSDDALRSGLL